MKKYDLRERTYKFSVELVSFLSNLAPARVSSPIFNQLIRSGTSIGANIEEADSSPTRKDFRHRIIIAKKEAAETVYWIRMIIDAELLKNENNVSKAKILLEECAQLLKILGSISRKVYEHDLEKSATKVAIDD